ncbi:uncharacterized protein [Aegilops tauschii subsp. strangulata]|uniref:uncharacterized protein isoform X3 n=1 Tax=Aegilops tauschii subsp. strangulata TaxID=200361 RepID=UPI00098A6582|nr:uncharacterized protein LOC109758773 isoform X2 [Aegilops tauschii subsp. strangulata]
MDIKEKELDQVKFLFVGLLTNCSCVLHCWYHSYPRSCSFQPFSNYTKLPKLHSHHGITTGPPLLKSWRGSRYRWVRRSTTGQHHVLFKPMPPQGITTGPPFLKSWMGSRYRWVRRSMTGQRRRPDGEEDESSSLPTSTSAPTPLTRALPPLPLLHLLQCLLPIGLVCLPVMQNVFLVLFYPSNKEDYGSCHALLCVVILV